MFGLLKKLDMSLTLNSGNKTEINLEYEREWDYNYWDYNIMYNASAILKDFNTIKHPEHIHSYISMEEIKYKNVKDKIIKNLTWPRLIGIGFVPNRREALAAAAIIVKSKAMKDQPNLKPNLSGSDICKILKVNERKIRKLVSSMGGKMLLKSSPRSCKVSSCKVPTKF